MLLCIRKSLLPPEVSGLIQAEYDGAHVQHCRSAVVPACSQSLVRLWLQTL